MKKAVIVFSGGLDSVCACVYLKSRYDLYGISFSYGQRASPEIKSAKKFAKILGLKEHKIIDIGFMQDLYGKTNVLTDSKTKLPSKFEYSIVVPIRNAVFLSIATAWAFSLKASLVAFGAHKGDKNYPDCRPSFSKKIQSAFNEGEIDGIKMGVRKAIKIWSPYQKNLAKSDVIKKGYKVLGNSIYKTWSCYSNKKFHCGKCESCNNRKLAFKAAKIKDKTKYMN
ncbi:MAG: queuosine biosynthesis QueC ATPase [Marine Group I thaumarchaeote]|nr:MAG: queuosine biosynthesis QueC ATPase [Marine Group I thaumarchaeote]